MNRRTLAGCCWLTSALWISVDANAEQQSTPEVLIGTTSITVSAEQLRKIEELEQYYRDEIAAQSRRWTDQQAATQEEQRRLRQLEAKFRKALEALLTSAQRNELHAKETAELRRQAAKDVQFLGAIGPFMESFLAADQVVCYEGFPRRLSDVEREEQRRKRKTAKFEGFDFYDEKQEIVPDDLRSLQQIFGNYRSFQSYGGPKFCGGYHPDWCLEWTAGFSSCRVYLCFGCHEARFVAGDASTTLMVDLDEDAYELLSEMVKKYLIHRSIPNKL